MTPESYRARCDAALAATGSGGNWNARYLAELRKRGLALADEEDGPFSFPSHYIYAPRPFGPHHAWNRSVIAEAASD